MVRAAAPGLMAGNTVLLKHADNVLGCADALAELFQSAGFAEGAFQHIPIETDRVRAVIEDDRVAAAKKSMKDVPWEDTPDTSQLFHLIHGGDVEGLEDWLEEEPEVAFLRSKDGRGPLWWAYEFDEQEIVELLISYGTEADAQDASGNRPSDMSPAAKGEL